MPDREFYRWHVSSFTVRVDLDVVDGISHQLRSPRFNPAEEQGGILYGDVLDTNSVEITGFEFIRSRHHRGAPYDLSLTERRNLERRVQALARRKGPRPIGYFRTHLRPGLFLDQSDFALMTEAFSDGPGIALAIRASEPNQGSAGIFFWEGGDIDRSQTKLMFPFDAAKLRAQGPIDGVSDALPAARPPRIAEQRFRARPAWIVGLACGLTGGILAFAALTVFHHSSDRPAISLDRASAAETGALAHSAISPFSQGTDQTVNAPPPAFEDDQPDARVAPAPVSHEAAPAREPELAPAPRAELPLPPPLPLPIPVTPLVVSPAAPIVSAVEPPRTAVNPTPSSEVRRVNVDISVEAKDGPLLKRVAGLAGHVPLVGRIHGLRHNEIVSPRPARDLTPQIPARVSRDLDDEIRVDVEASIDDSGVVRNAEVTQGAGTEFGPLAVAKVRSVQWQPARTGDHSVPMDVVVHYRFSPARQ